MTEDEAKTKACCGPPAVFLMMAINAGIEPKVGDGNCFGSSCMAWRWTVAQGVKLERHEFDGSVTDQTPVQGHGYCGLAGKP
jgi:hypothetical protein